MKDEKSLPRWESREDSQGSSNWKANFKSAGSYAFQAARTAFFTLASSSKTTTDDCQEPLIDFKDNSNQNIISNNKSDSTPAPTKNQKDNPTVKNSKVKANNQENRPKPLMIKDIAPPKTVDEAPTFQQPRCSNCSKPIEFIHFDPQKEAQDLKDVREWLERY